MALDKVLYRANAPLRLGLAGGGTDISPYCDIYGGAVLNVTIGRYAQATIELLDEPEIRFSSQDLDTSEVFPLTPEIALDGGLILHRAVYNEIISRYNNGEPMAVAITTHVDCPVGSGLGSSSALVIAMVQAFKEVFNLPLGEYDIARTAFEIERLKAGLAGGRQDQYAAAFGGLNFIEFHDQERVIVNPLRLSRRVRNELEASLVLCFTGVSRASATIIRDQIKSAEQEGQAEALEAMHQIKRHAIEMKEALLIGDLQQMADILTQSWHAKKSTSKMMTNDGLDDLYDCAMQNGAAAGKISGAGGGGFMFFLVDTTRRDRLMNALREAGGTVSYCTMVANGAESWRATSPLRHKLELIA